MDSSMPHPQLSDITLVARGRRLGHRGARIPTRRGMDMLLQDKVAVISGVGSGMGREMALAFAREGADVVIASRNDVFLGTVAEEVRGLGRSVVAVPTDVSDAEQRTRLADATR